MRKFIQNFIHHESIGGIILFIATAMALYISNSSLYEWYQSFFQKNFFGHTYLFWINDGLMALFFLLVGLELKRELVEGELSDFSQALLPGISALGGMLFPIVIYCLCNFHDSLSLQGWAIPVATDIAFALGALSLLGKRIPLGLKVFLLALAIFDDVGSIFIIAFFHSHQLNLFYGLGALAILLLLILLNRFKIYSLFVYLLLGIILWAFVLKSGIHSTLAGVLLAFTIPLKVKDSEKSPLIKLEKNLHFWVYFFVMPLFAFANAGLSLKEITPAIILAPTSLGIIMGLFLGKQIGVFGTASLLIKRGWAKLPQGATWGQLYGVSILCGIGFTMSLFLGTLSFQNMPSYLTQVRFGVLVGSILSGVVGTIILCMLLPKKSKREF